MPPFSPTSHMAVDSLSTLIIGGGQYLDWPPCLPLLHFCGINARGARYRGRLQCIWEPRERELLAFNLSPRSCTHQAYLHTDDGQRQPDMV